MSVVVGYFTYVIAVRSACRNFVHAEHLTPNGSARPNETRDLSLSLTLIPFVALQLPIALHIFTHVPNLSYNLPCTLLNYSP